MASAFLGPESHRPLAVITESYQTKLKIPILTGDDKFCFGTEYEKKLYSLIHEHLELDTTDKLVYVGDIKGSLSKAIEDHFCLIHPVQTLVPGHFHFIETYDGHRTLPVRIAHVGAEEHFRILAKDRSTHSTKYDKILVNDCVRYLEEPVTAYRNMIASLAPGGKLLIIHRTGELNTLPYFRDACQRITDNNISYTSILKDLQDAHLDVSWEVECLTVCMPKKKWLAMVRDKFPTQMEVLSDIEVMSGIRELSEGMFKYEGDMVEFVDRLLFISATPCEQPFNQSDIRRSRSQLGPKPTTETYIMHLWPEQLRMLKGEPDL
uniref:Uncharacterized protein n=1 Tax=Arion vulgaris TaxID=1028688 RepID=A0A0B6Z4B3_9EUPU